jgi:hypothetical protein
MQLQIGRPVVIESLRLALVSATELQIEGTLNTTTAQSEAAQHLSALHDHIMAEKLSSFTVDLRKLTFVNSSAIRLFVDWIARASTAHYKLVFMTDRSITWHRLSFSVLKSLAPASIEVV